MIDLTKPEKNIVAFDLETTGVSTTSDRIVEIAMIKIGKDMKVMDKLHHYVNPQMAIPDEATKIHGITDAHVKSSPTFYDIHESILKFIDSCDLVGFNSNRFDVPLLSSEFYRVGYYGFPSGTTKLFDSMVIFKQAFPQNIEGAYERYTGKKVKRKEHSALEDTQLLVETFLSQLKTHNSDFKFLTWDAFQRFNCYEKLYFDVDQKIYISSQIPYFAFGKWQDKPIKDHHDYARWMLNTDFHLDTKLKLCLIMKGGGALKDFMQNKLSQTEIIEIARQFMDDI